MVRVGRIVRQRSNIRNVDTIAGANADTDDGVSALLEPSERLRENRVLHCNVPRFVNCILPEIFAFRPRVANVAAPARALHQAPRFSVGDDNDNRWHAASPPGACGTGTHDVPRDRAEPHCWTSKPVPFILRESLQIPLHLADARHPRAELPAHLHLVRKLHLRDADLVGAGPDIEAASEVAHERLALVPLRIADRLQGMRRERERSEVR